MRGRPAETVLLATTAVFASGPAVDAKSPLPVQLNVTPTSDDSYCPVES
jgi:hypothetical protein